MTTLDYRQKYMKYKKKYFNLKDVIVQKGGALVDVFEIKCKIKDPESATDLGVDADRWEEEKEYVFIYAYATFQQVAKLYLKEKPGKSRQIVDCAYNDDGKKDEDNVIIPRDIFYFELDGGAEIYMDTDGMEMERLLKSYDGTLKLLDEWFDDAYDDVPDAVSYRKINDFFRNFEFDESEEEQEEEEEEEFEEWEEENEKNN